MIRFDKAIEQINQEIKDRDLTMRQLAAAAGVEYEWLVKYAAGKIPHPRIDHFSKLAKYFNEN